MGLTKEDLQKKIKELTTLMDGFTQQEEQTARRSGTPVLVTTEHRGVFFGYIPEGGGEVDGKLFLKDAKMCLYWPTAVNGFMGLASKGPLEDSKVSSKSDITLKAVTSISPCTPEAVTLWESYK